MLFENTGIEEFVEGRLIGFAELGEGIDFFALLGSRRLIDDPKLHLDFKHRILKKGESVAHDAPLHSIGTLVDDLVVEF